ncbi:MAG: ATP-dependent DNA helicase RecG [Clostridia bacterium]|nr:ATP-dependent DNA helicase RecG [Clostridia bacterium]
MNRELTRKVNTLFGVGEDRAKKLGKLGIFTIFDLISYFPRDYEDRTRIKTISELVPDEMVCVEGIVSSVPKRKVIRKGLEISTVRVVDEGGGMEMVFFNQKYATAGLKLGERYVFYGKTVLNGHRMEMHSPEYERKSDNVKTGRIVPIYPLTAGITRNMMAAYIRGALGKTLDLLIDPIPEEYRYEYNLAHQVFSYRNIHYPENGTLLEAARNRMIFEELLVFAMGLGLLKKRRAPIEGIKMEKVSLSPFLDKLPFKLTGAQSRAIENGIEDMCKGIPMNRLVQGDVGSGKTMVAAALAFFAAQNKYQTALMAPTEILATQHFETLSPIFESLGLKCELLIGSTTAANKRKIKARLDSGEIDIAIGTHALISDDVTFSNLGLVITDEQHRFGVGQRATLMSKGKNPHLLVMSATPIPRTLALILYGDLDVSIIDELPPGRKEVKTVAINDEKRKTAYSFMAGEIQKGRQIYIVCPLVEENDELELKSAKQYAEKLGREVFPNVKVAFLHGKMKSREKEEIMSAFSANEIQILVSTTVIEVGVNVPNATVMAVENAERFGLSQLHQLRGRVGRGSEQSYCILFSNHTGEVARARMKALCATNDGFKISEEDLKLRGPGDFFGTKQHGVPNLRIADLAHDLVTLQKAQKVAFDILKKDPTLEMPEHTELADRVKLLFKEEEYGDIFN